MMVKAFMLTSVIMKVIIKLKAVRLLKWEATKVYVALIKIHYNIRVILQLRTYR